MVEFDENDKEYVRLLTQLVEYVRSRGGAVDVRYHDKVDNYIRLEIVKDDQGGILEYMTFYCDSDEEGEQELRDDEGGE